MKNLLTLIFLAGAAVAYGQTDFDKRLLEKYPKAQILELQESNPEILKYWTFFLDNGYVIADMPAGKENNIKEEVKIKNLDRFNIFSLGVGTPGEHVKYFKIRNTDKILVVLSNDQFVSKFKAYQAKN